LVLQDIGRFCTIDGDHIMEVHWLDSAGIETGSAVLDLPPNTKFWQFKIPSEARKVKFALKMHYSHPRGQWVNFVYTILGKNGYDTFFIPLLVFNSNGDPVEYSEYAF